MESTGDRMTDLFVTTVKVPMFIDSRWDLFVAIRAGAKVAKVQPGDEAHAIFEGVKKDVDGWPIKIYTVKITRGE